MSNGESVIFAVEDIIDRGVGEIRKTIFGEGSEEGKALPWSQGQAWTVIKQLADKVKVKTRPCSSDFLISFI
jgi:hypothetical protein